MAANPAYDAVAALAGSVTLPNPPGGSAVTLTAGTSLFVGPAREPDSVVPAQAVFVVNSGGAPPALTMPSTAMAGNVFRAMVRVVVRSNLDDFSGGEALARGCYAKLFLVVISGYLWCRPVSAEVDYLGMDERGLHSFGFSAELAYQAA